MQFVAVLLLSLFVAATAYSPDPRRLSLQNPDLYDGDMLNINGAGDVIRNAIPGKQFRWPEKKIPYIISEDLKEHTKVIKEGIENYHKHTCLRFHERTDEFDYINIIKGDGCYSDVGRVGGVNQLSLGSGCQWVGTVIHELGHAIGFYHEHSRSDRDEYLDIFLQNVEEDMKSNFDKLSPDRNLLLAPFDYDSIMIYGNDAFSKNGKDTMRAKNRRKISNPYDKESMTKNDILAVNKMYDCP